MHFLIALGASLVLTPIVRRVGLAAVAALGMSLLLVRASVWGLGSLAGGLGRLAGSLPTPGAVMLTCGAAVAVALAGYRLWAGRARHLRQPQ